MALLDALLTQLRVHFSVPPTRIYVSSAGSLFCAARARDKCSEIMNEMLHACKNCGHSKGLHSVALSCPKDKDDQRIRFHTTQKFETAICGNCGCPIDVKWDCGCDPHDA